MKTLKDRQMGVGHSRFLRVLTAAIFFGSISAGVCQTEDPDHNPFWYLGENPFDQVKLSLAPEYFYWHEQASGQTFVREDGFRIGLEASYKEPKDGGWLWAVRGKFYGGSVTYNGGLQNPFTGAVTPLKSTTRYLGGLLEARYGYRWAVCGDYYLDLMGGLMAEYWDRHLDAGFGEDEYWLPLSAKAGFDLSPKTVGWLGDIGAKVPFYTYQESHEEAFGAGTVTLNPQPMVSGYAELGYQFTRHISMSVFFDSYYFRQSPTVESGFFLVYQPESVEIEAGGKLTWTF